MSEHELKRASRAMEGALQITCSSMLFFELILRKMRARFDRRGRDAHYFKSPLYWKDCRSALFFALESHRASHALAARLGRRFDLPRFDVKGLPVLFNCVVPQLVQLDDVRSDITLEDGGTGDAPAYMCDVGRLKAEFGRWRAYRRRGDAARRAVVDGRAFVITLLDDAFKREVCQRVIELVDALFAGCEATARLKRGARARALCLMAPTYGERDVGEALDGVIAATNAAGTPVVFVDTTVLD